MLNNSTQKIINTKKYVKKYVTICYSKKHSCIPFVQVHNKFMHNIVIQQIYKNRKFCTENYKNVLHNVFVSTNSELLPLIHVTQ